jgi:hypothetical protein
MRFDMNQTPLMKRMCHSSRDYLPDLPGSSVGLDIDAFCMRTRITNAANTPSWCDPTWKGRGLGYLLMQTPDWLKMKNPACAVVKREAEED